MKLALVPLEHWEQLNQQLKEHFSMPSDNTLRVYKGLAHATYEIVQGLVQFMSHKRNLGVVKGQTPYFEPVLATLYKDAFGIQSITHTESAAARETWVQGLKKDTSFVLFAEDHPVTGELYDWEKLDEVLDEKKIFSIRISHFRHFYDRTPLRPHSVQICYLNSDLAIVKCGDRFKVPPMLAPFMNWEIGKTLEQIKKIHVSDQDPVAVKAFEKEFSSVATPWFASSPETPRLYDRILLNFKDVSGELLLSTLQEKLQLETSQLLQTLDTTNLCRWNQYRTFSSWWEPKPSEEDLQGLLVIDSGWLVTKDFTKILAQTCEEIRAQQSW